MLQPNWKEKDSIGRDLKFRRRLPSKARSKFEEWVIFQGGFQAVADKLGCSRGTVQNWCDAKTAPSLELAYRIVTLAGGQLTYDDLVEGTGIW